MGETFLQVNEQLRHLGKPTIARVNGMAVGGGNEFQISCDLAIAADHAQFFQVGTSVGSVAAISCWFLPLMIGDRRAREMLLLNKRIDAKTALEWGLVNEVVPKEKLDDAVNEMAQQLVHKFADCLRYTIQQVNYFKDQVSSALGGGAGSLMAVRMWWSRISARQRRAGIPIALLRAIRRIALVIQKPYPRSSVKLALNLSFSIS